MRILYWNTCLTTDPQALFDRLMVFNQSYKEIDYFCINEATLSLSELFKKTGWQVFYVANTRDRGVMIASKHPLRKRRSYTLSSVMRRGNLNSNHLLMVEARWRNKPITIATTHLSYLRVKEFLRRRQERKALTKCLPRNATVFGGDLNTIVVPFAKWDIIRLGYQSKVRGKTWCWHLKNTFRRIPIKLQLDHVFASHDIQNIVSAEILKEQKLSDHFPMMVRLH